MVTIFELEIYIDTFKYRGSIILLQRNLTQLYLVLPLPMERSLLIYNRIDILERFALAPKGCLSFCMSGLQVENTFWKWETPFVMAGTIFLKRGICIKSIFVDLCWQFWRVFNSFLWLAKCHSSHLHCCLQRKWWEMMSRRSWICSRLTYNPSFVCMIPCFWGSLPQSLQRLGGLLS